MPTENGYSNQKKKGGAQFKTINYVGSDQFGAPIIQKTLYDITPVALAIVSVTDVIGIDGQVEFWNIQITAHLATKNNILRMITGTLKGWEYNIVRVIDANNLYILPISDTKPIAAETAKTMGWITSKSDDQGNLTVIVPPTVGGATEAKQDIQIALMDYAPVGFSILDFGVTNVDDSAYVEVIASSPATRKIQVFMSSGEPLYIAFGAAASEVDQAIIIPGGNGLIDFVIPAATRVSVIAVNAVTVSSGVLLINYLG